MEQKKLHRNTHDKMIAGVASGLAEYMQVEATIIRLLFVLATVFLAGTGLLVYIILWIILPEYNDFSKFTNFGQPFGQAAGSPYQAASSQPTAEGTTGTTGASADPIFGSTTSTEPNFTQTPPDFSKMKNSSKDTGRLVGGLFLIVIGCYFLFNQFGLIPYWFRIGKLWPLIFVAIGVSFLLKSGRKNAWDQFTGHGNANMGNANVGNANVGNKTEEVNKTDVGTTPEANSPAPGKTEENKESGDSQQNQH